MSLYDEIRNDKEMMSILLDTARNEMLQVKDAILNDLIKLLYNRYLDIAIKENCLDPVKMAKECAEIEIKIIMKKPISEIYEDLRLYQRLLNK